MGCVDPKHRSGKLWHAVLALADSFAQIGKGLRAAVSRMPLAVALGVPPLQLLEFAHDIDHDGVTQSGNVGNFRLITKKAPSRTRPEPDTSNSRAMAN